MVVFFFLLCFYLDLTFNMFEGVPEFLLSKAEIFFSFQRFVYIGTHCLYESITICILFYINIFFYFG